MTANFGSQGHSSVAW